MLSVLFDADFTWKLTRSGTFTTPSDGPSCLSVEMWGAGGGGTTCSYADPGYCFGGSGGGGAYGAIKLDVPPGTACNVTINGGRMLVNAAAPVGSDCVAAPFQARQYCTARPQTSRCRCLLETVDSSRLTVASGRMEAAETLQTRRGLTSPGMAGEALRTVTAASRTRTDP